MLLRVHALQHGDWETSSQSSWATDRAMDGFPSDRRLHVEVTGLTAWTSRQCEVSSVRASTTTPAFKVLQDNPALRWNVRAERQEQRGDINLLLLPLNLQLVASLVATTYTPALCVCVCMRVYVCVCVCVSVRARTRARARVCVLMRVYVCACVSL